MNEQYEKPLGLHQQQQMWILLFEDQL